VVAAALQHGQQEVQREPVTAEKMFAAARASPRVKIIFHQDERDHPRSEEQYFRVAGFDGHAHDGVRKTQHKECDANVAPLPVFMPLMRVIGQGVGHVRLISLVHNSWRHFSRVRIAASH